MTQISEFIEDLTGISNSDVESMPIIDEVKKNFEDFYLDHEDNQHLIIAHNANFDIGFLIIDFLPFVRETSFSVSLTDNDFFTIFS